MKESRKKKSGGKKSVPVFLAVLLILSLLFYRESLKEIWEGIRQVTAVELIFSVIFASFGYVLEGMTITSMMKIFLPQALAGDGIFIAFVCEFYRLTTLGNGSGIAEIYYLHEKEIEPGSAAVLTMIQYMIKRIAIMVLGVLGFTILFYKKSTRGLCEEYAVFMGAGSIITVVIILAFLCLVLSPKITGFLLIILDKISSKLPAQKERIGKWEEQIRLLNKSGKSVLEHRKEIAEAGAFQIAKLMLFYLIPAYLLSGKTMLAAGECILLMALCYMLSGVIPAPSGAGSLEFVFLLFFSSFADTQTAVPAILIFRFATWICSAVIGGVWILVRRGIHRERTL